MSAFNIPNGCSLSDIEGPQMSDDEAIECELEIADLKYDLQKGDVDE